MKTESEIKNIVVSLLSEAGQKAGNLAKSLEISFNDQMITAGYSRNEKGEWIDQYGSPSITVKQCEHQVTVIVQSLKEAHGDCSTIVKTVMQH